MAELDRARIEKVTERYGSSMIWRPYGYPEIVDPFRTAFADVEVMPRWSVDETVFISTAISGAFYSKRANPNQPITTDEIRSSALEAIDAGAPAVHIHVRDDRGYNVLSPERFAEVIEPIRRQHPDVLVDGCLVAAVDGEWERIEPMLKSKLLDCVPVNTTAAYFGDALFAKPPHLMIRKAEAVQLAGARVEIAVYTDADVDNARRYLIAPGILEKPYVWIVLPALPGCSPMHSPREMTEGLQRIVHSILDIDADSVVVVCAAGRASTYLTALALTLGLHVRVGMEDTIWTWPHRDDLLGSNAQHFTMARQLAELLGRRVQTPAETRGMLGLSISSEGQASSPEVLP